MLLCRSPFSFSSPAHQEIIKVVQPLFLGKITQYLEFYDPDNSVALYEALGYAAGLSITSLILAVVHHCYFYQLQRIGMKIRVAMCHMIYKKVGAPESKLSSTLFSSVVDLNERLGEWTQCL